jgi:hypothetical protein
MRTFSAEFLNVDLEIKSTVDPGPLVQAWDDQVFQLYADRLGRRHWLRLTLAAQPKSPSDAIRRFAKLVDRLPRQGATIWARAAKEFDIGVQAGFERRAGEWVLQPQVVQTVANLGAHLRFTVYSPLLLMEESVDKKRRRIGPGTNQ